MGSQGKFMPDIDLVKRLAEESQNLIAAQKNYDSAKSAVLSWLERDMERSEGSGAQEARREGHYENLCQEESGALCALNNQKETVRKVAEQLFHK